MKQRILYKVNSIITILIFSIAIFLPFSIGIIEKDMDISEIEKRKLFKFPEKPKDLNDIKKFPKLFETYYSDHFGLRDWFNEYYMFVKYNLGDSPSEDVTIGKDGWLFLGSIKKGYTGYSDPIGDFRGVNLYSKSDLDNLLEYMITLQSWLYEKGIEYVFVIAPNKHTIYFDKLPDYISKVNEHSATDQLVKHLKLHTKIPVVDLRSKLINSKDKYQLYNKTDTHWNHYGANIAQYEIMLEIEKLFPEQIQPEMMNLRDGIRGGADLSGFIGVHNVKELDPRPIFKETCTPKKEIYDNKERKKYTWICEKQKLNALIFMDSFFEKLQPYFSRKLKRSTYILGKTNYSSLIKHLELEKPDIVIEEWVERSVPYVPKIIPEFNKSLIKKTFNRSTDFIFSNDWKKLKFNKYINIIDDDNFINLKSTGSDPIISFPLLPFQANKKYILHIAMTSSKESTLQLFYSDSRISDYTFSEKNSIQLAIKKGDNDLYIPLDYQNIGKHLRLDPISGKGEVTIKSLNIKRIPK